MITLRHSIIYPKEHVPTEICTMHLLGVLYVNSESHAEHAVKSIKLLCNDESDKTYDLINDMGN